jgi:hypothetical protein
MKTRKTRKHLTWHITPASLRHARFNLGAARLFALAGLLAAALKGQVSAPPIGVGPAVPERPSVAISRRVPQFGGMFIAADRALQYYVTDTSPAVLKSAESAIHEFMGASRIPAAGIRAVQGQYSYTQLREWHQRHRLISLAIPGVVMTGIKESQNRLMIGIERPEVRSDVERALNGVGVPTAAVSFQVMEADSPLTATLQDRTRPLEGGIQISNGSGPCTLGVLAVRNSVAGFLTASHCTKIQGGVESTVFHQPAMVNSTTASSQIGVELLDPPYTTGDPDCPSGKECRYSDTAFVKRAAAADMPLVTADFGYIAMPADSSLEIIGKFHIEGKVLFPAEGETLSKVGRTTGFSEGQVIDTCVDMLEKGTNIVLFCQDRVQAKSAGGDSGSPVFSGSSALLPPGGTPGANLYGILWGGNSSHTIFDFSSLGNILIEIGWITVFPGDAGTNSPPEVRITVPIDNGNPRDEQFRRRPLRSGDRGLRRLLHGGEVDV